MLKDNHEIGLNKITVTKSSRRALEASIVYRGSIIRNKGIPRTSEGNINTNNSSGGNTITPRSRDTTAHRGFSGSIGRDSGSRESHRTNRGNSRLNAANRTTPEPYEDNTVIRGPHGANSSGFRGGRRGRRFQGGNVVSSHSSVGYRGVSRKRGKKQCWF